MDKEILNTWTKQDFTDLSYSYRQHPVSWQGNYYQAKLSAHIWKERKVFYLPLYLNWWGGHHPIKIIID